MLYCNRRFFPLVVVMFAALCVALFSGCSEDAPSTTSMEPVNENSGSSLLPFVGGAPVVFTEVDPVNLTYKDHEGGDDGWVEVFNPADTAVNLAGLALTDAQTEPQKWVLGNVVVPPQSFMLVFLSRKNLPDFVPPHDTLNMMGPGCWTWTDAQNEDVAGFSYANPLEGRSRNCFKADGVSHVGAVMKFGDNEELGWSSISVFVGTGSTDPTDVLDMSAANELLLTGFISKDRVLSLRLAQPDIDDWKGYEITFMGTGDSTTTYRAMLPTGTTFPDLANIYGTRISPESKEMQEVTMDISSYIVRNRGHEPHASFKASKKGGSLYLVNAQSQILDSVAYPELPTGKSWALGTSSVGAMIWGYAESSPYGATLGVVSGELSPSPSAKLPPSGFYAQPVALAFDAGENVRCELGGAFPTELSPQVTSLVLDSTSVVRCASFVAGATPSPVETRTYLFESQPAVASVFVVGDPGAFFDPDTGIYMEGPNAQTAEPHYGANYWLDKELPVFVELFEPGVNSPAFAENAGFQIFGNYSRMQKKKSVAIVFREKYGNNRLKYPLFPEFPELKKFKWFVLRNNGGNYGSNYIQDRLASSITEGLGVDYQRGRPAVVYYNGEYYGIHNIREKSNEYYFETHYGYDPDEIDLLKADNSVTSGSAVDYVALMDWLETHHLDNDENYAYVASLMDVDNFMNYVHTEIFVNNRDWPGNNLKKWRCHNPGTPWRWFLYDLDFGFGNNHSEYKNNIFEFATAENGESWPNGPEYTLLLRRMLENEDFRAAFVNRMAVLLSMNFESGRILSRIDAMMSEMESEVARDQKRWNLNASHMKSGLDQLKTFASERQAIVMQELAEYFKLLETVSVTLSVEGGGRILVHGLPLDRPEMKIDFFTGLGISVTAMANGSEIFTGWSDGETSPTRVIMPENGVSYTAKFK